jgi:hypothetical protein
MPPYQLAASIFYVVFTQGSLRWKHSQRAMTAGDEEWAYRKEISLFAMTARAVFLC